MNSKAPLFTGIFLIMVGLGIAALGLAVPMSSAAGKPICVAVGAFIAASGLFTLLTRRWLGSLLLTLTIISLGALAYGAIADDGAMAGSGVICLVVTGAAAAVADRRNGSAAASVRRPPRRRSGGAFGATAIESAFSRRRAPTRSGRSPQRSQHQVPLGQASAPTLARKRSPSTPSAAAARARQPPKTRNAAGSARSCLGGTHVLGG